MSRRVSRIQIPVVTTNRIRPMIESHQPSVVPITMQVTAIPTSNGSALGPGRWISSPAGGVSSFVAGHQCT